MININGNIVENISFPTQNRALRYGDGLFETIKFAFGKIIFLEDHYFRMMSSMRVLRMEIPMSFSMEFIQNEIEKTIKSNSLSQKPCRIKLSICRKDGGLYTPKTNQIDYIIEVLELSDNDFVIANINYCTEIFPDFKIQQNILSNIKSNNRIVNVLASIFSKENKLENCILLSENKNICEASNSNIFVITDGKIKTPPLSDGCINGVMRGNIIRIIEQKTKYSVEEISISAFEMKKADEIFLTNAISGIIPVSQNNGVDYQLNISLQILELLNKEIKN